MAQTMLRIINLSLSSVWAVQTLIQGLFNILPTQGESFHTNSVEYLEFLSKLIIWLKSSSKLFRFKFGLYDNRQLIVCLTLSI